MDAFVLTNTLTLPWVRINNRSTTQTIVLSSQLVYSSININVSLRILTNPVKIA
jgi:hypothetical protein